MWRGSSRGGPPGSSSAWRPSVPLLGAFALRQRRLVARGGAPLINLELFRERAFSAGVVISLAYQMIMASFFLVLALVLPLAAALHAGTW